MESPATTAAAAAAGPCVYVPISHPDSPVPTYAVLQVLGISPAPDPSAHPQFTAPMRPCSSPASTPPSPAPKRCASSAESTNSSSSDERDKHFTSLKPTPMKKSASGTGITSPGLSPAARRSGKILPFKPIISITHTDKDTIIHTDPADFRKVVHQLTGAASGDKGLMPITTPARSVTANRSGVGNDRDSTLPASNAQATTLPSLGRENAVGSDYMDCASARKPVGNSTAMNLLERRKSNKVLGRLLMTSCKKSTALMPSPVTPLASDFEKISLPLTPSSSEGSLTPGRLASAACLSPLSHGTKALETLSLSGGISSHANGTVKDSIEVKSCRTEAMDIQPPEMSQLCLQTPNLRSRDDVHVASSNHTRSIERPNGDAARDGDVLSLALAPATGDLISNSSDVQNGEAPSADEDAMDTEILGEAVVAHNTSATASISSFVDDEGSIIAKKGFFFHAQRPCHVDPMLLALFPESSREV